MKNYNLFFIIASIFFSINLSGYSFSYEQNPYSLNNLSSAEMKIFGYSNNKFTPNERLAIVERQLFGTIQSGDFDSRINFINNVLNNSNQYQPNYYNDMKKTNRLKYIINDIFQGSMTGYSPNVLTFPEYNNYQNTTPQIPSTSRVGNFITQTRVIIDD